MERAELEGVKGQEAEAPYPILATNRCNYGRNEPGPAPITTSRRRDPRPRYSEIAADNPSRPPPPRKPAPKIQIDPSFLAAKRRKRRPPARADLIVRQTPPAQPRPPTRFPRSPSA